MNHLSRHAAFAAGVAVDCRNHHGEGVFWNALDGQLWWTDIEGKSLWSFDPRSGRSQTYPMPERVCCFAPRARGGFVLGMASGFAFWQAESGAVEPLAAFEPELPHTRLNDGRTDRQGRFVAGGMDERAGAPVSTVCRLEADLSVTPLFAGVSCANSICFSPDGQAMYFADSPARTIRMLDYGAELTPSLATSRVIGRLENGLPDGSCVDAEGGLWNAVWEGGRLERWLPDGTLERTIGLPVRKPTCCAFGGDALDTLYITTSRLNSTADELAADPLAGVLLAIKPGVRGLIDVPFAG
jgi:L-arabinonolactonase